MRRLKRNSYLFGLLPTLVALLVSSLRLPSPAQDTTKESTLQRKGNLPILAILEDSYQRRWGRQSLEESGSTGNPQVALALSGGGARGLAHIGVLRAFEEAEIEIVAIAGTSMGGIVGGLYSAGISTDQIKELAQNVNFRTLFSNSPRRQALFLTQRENIDHALLSLRFDKGKPSIPTGLSSAQRLTEVLSILTLRQNYAAGADFTKLSIPFTTVATDISTGEKVILDHGNLADAIRATMAFPLAISAVEIDGRMLMDGGMVEPIPVGLAKGLLNGKRLIPTVAVNTTKKLLPKGAIKDPFDMATQVTTIMSLRELHEELGEADYVITPKVGAGNGVDFNHVEDFVSAGYTETRDVIVQILQKHDSTLMEKSLQVLDFTIEGVSGLADELEELLGSLVSRARLDEVFLRRWNQGDLVSLEISASSVTSQDSSDVKLTHLKPTHLKLVHLKIMGISQPALNEIQIVVENNSQERFALVEDYLEKQITASGAVRIDSISEWTRQHFRDAGSELCAVRECFYDSKTKTVQVLIDEALGAELTISGTSRTRDSFVRDRIGSFGKGAPFTLEVARRAYRDIYGSGLFERVSIEVTPTEQGADVKVLVHEKSTLQMQFGYHWDDEYRGEGFLTALESNILGIGIEGRLLAQFADRRQRFSAGLRTDRIFRTHVALNLEAYATKLDRRLLAPDEVELGFRRERRYGASFRLGQQISRFGILSAAVILEHVESTEPDASPTTEYELRKIQIRSLVEDFDRTSFTRTGRKHIVLLETAGKIFGGATEYVKWFSSIESYFPLTERLNFHPRITAAFSRANLPKPERFYIGGLDSFEGFRSTELSGSKILLANLELRYMVFPRVYLITRYNAGNTYGRTEDMNIDNLRYGWAAALGIDTPVGPFIFGYGRASESRDRVYFQAGLRF